MQSDQRPADKGLGGTKVRWVKRFGIGVAFAIAAVAGLSFWLPVNLPLHSVLAAQPAFKNEAHYLERLKVPEGYEVNLYAFGLGRARLMEMTPKGDILISSLGGTVFLVKADQSGDGRSDAVTSLMTDLSLPHGLWLDGDWLYVAEVGRVFRVAYDAEKRVVLGKREIMVSGIPDTGGHSTRTVRKGPDGAFYVTVGSSCNVCVEKHPWRAAMIRFVPGETATVFATGLRNTVGFDWQPETGDLYSVDNGRDWLGDNFPPGEVNRIVEGGFYGWPFYNGDNVLDVDLGKSPSKPDRAPIAPAHKFAAHVAALSIRFLKHQEEGRPHHKAALVAQHGSWNRKTKIGYRVVSLHWGEDGKIAQRPFLTGFEMNGSVIGRPVDILEAPDGTIYVSDDYVGAIWRVVYTGKK